MLELYEGKLSRTVLRRGNGGNSVPLAGAFWVAARPCWGRSVWWRERRYDVRPGVPARWLSGTHFARGLGAHYQLWRAALLEPCLGRHVFICGAPGPHLLGLPLDAWPLAAV